MGKKRLFLRCVKRIEVEENLVLPIVFLLHKLITDGHVFLFISLASILKCYKLLVKISHKSPGFWLPLKNPKIWQLDLSSHKTTVGSRGQPSPLNGARVCAL